MEDRQHGSLGVSLDFRSEDRAQLVSDLLEFAEIPQVNQGDIAAVAIGDGHHAANYAGYVQLIDSEQMPSVLSHVITLRQPLRQTALLGALAQAISQAAQSRPQSAVLSQFVGVSDAVQEVRQMIERAAERDVTVLVTGESGTGKEVVARTLHQCSARHDQPFVPVNCGAIPAELLESELFGHEKGAFTGAITQKTGRFELAHGGTLFLDEIGDMPFAMQVKLLRAIEQKSFERVGSAETRVSDVRIVAATNIDLEQQISNGAFREDLYYRLAVFTIELAPLRARTEDLPVLINALMSRIQSEQGLHVKFSVDALALLGQYPWPGNVRELANLLQRLAIEYPNGLVRCQDLPKKYAEPAQTPSAAQSDSLPGDILLPLNGIDLKDYLTRLEKRLIEQALDDTNAVVARAADRLHIRRTTLVEKMRKYGINRGVGASVSGMDA